MATTFLVQAAVCCACFHAVIVRSVKRSPMNWFYDYPKAVRDRMRALPQYAGKLPTRQFNVKKKGLAALFCVAFFLCMARAAGLRAFWPTAAYSFALWTVINFYDALVLDTIWFCHNETIRFPGTEDMVSDYEDPTKHWVDFGIGSVIGAAVALLAAGANALLPL